MPKGPVFRIGDVIGVFRSLEQNDDALVVLGDDDAMRVAVAWSHTDQDWTRPTTAQPKTAHGRIGRLWSWLVSGWTIDAREVARLAGVPRSVAHMKLEMLIGNRLIYPDGEMSGGLRKVLAVHTAKKLGLRQAMPAAVPAVTKPRDEGN